MNKEKYAIVLMLIVLVTMGIFIGTQTERAPKTEMAIDNEGQTLPIFYVSAKATRYSDYVEVEYNGNMYSTWIDANSTIKTGDYVWAGFYVYGGEVEFVGIR